jgi:hypothetical protein
LGCDARVELRRQSPYVRVMNWHGPNVTSHNRPVVCCFFVLNNEVVWDAKHMLTTHL